MTSKQSYELNQKEKAYELANYFSNILSYKEARSLKKEDFDFLYDKMLKEKEVEDINEIVDNVITGKNNTTEYEQDEIKVYKLGRCKTENFQKPGTYSDMI